jgi:hypothetical protein
MTATGKVQKFVLERECMISLGISEYSNDLPVRALQWPASPSGDHAGSATERGLRFDRETGATKQ